jgi:hypothetical protein
MAEFLRTAQAITRLEEMLGREAGHLILISPYVKLSGNIEHRIRYAATSRSLPITMVVRSGQQKKQVTAPLLALPGVEVREIAQLHAKCYCDDNAMVLTSLNLLASSEGNFEMGVLLTRAADREAFESARREVDLIVGRSTPLVARSEAQKGIIDPDEDEEEEPGYCIRCAALLEFNPDKPLCRGCYEKWAEWRNPAYSERVCHSCGEVTKTSVERPLCRRCFNQMVVM